MGLINKGSYGMFFTCGIWCLADVLSVSPLSEQTEGIVGVTVTVTGTGYPATNIASKVATIFP